MNNELEKYLKTEREISQFKIESLKRVSEQSNSVTKRLIEIEEEFLSIKFEDMATTMSDLFAAIKIFRDSRRAFHELYPPQSKKENWVEEDIFIQFIIKKIKEKTLLWIKERGLSGVKEERSIGRFLAISLCIILYLEKIDSDLNNLKKGKHKSKFWSITIKGILAFVVLLLLGAAGALSYVNLKKNEINAIDSVRREQIR